MYLASRNVPVLSSPNKRISEAVPPLGSKKASVRCAVNVDKTSVLELTPPRHSLAGLKVSEYAGGCKVTEKEASAATVPAWPIGVPRVSVGVISVAVSPVTIPFTVSVSARGGVGSGPGVVGPAPPHADSRRVAAKNASRKCFMSYLLQPMDNY